jgi:uncharacterized protein YerC
MARIAKKQLSQAHLDTLFIQLHTVLSNSSPKQVGSFLHELLGREERIMLAKRLAVIVMLSHGNSLYKTAQTLQVSTATAGKMQERLQRNDYTQLLTLLKKNKKQYHSFLETLDSLLHLGGVLPHYTGMDRYRNLNKNLSIN